MRAHAIRILCVGLLLVFGSGTSLAQTQPIRYIYDDLGRLVSVIDQTGAAAIYTYDPVGNLLAITRQNPGVVSILEFSPGSGSVGQTVILYGTGFSATPAQNSVTFDGTSATVTAATTTSITTTVPVGASTGSLAVTTPSGSATSASAFTLTSGTTPTITGFTPTIGTLGTAVTISGTNFDPTLLNNRIALNLTRAWPGSGTSTSLASTVPLAAGSGRIAVVTPSGSATSTADFFVPPPPFVASDVEFTDRMTLGDTRSVPITTSTKVGVVIFDAVAGSRISLKAVPGPIGTIKMYRPDLAVIKQAGVGIFAILLEPEILTHTGTYSILVDPAGTGTGTTALTLYSVPPDFTGTIAAGDANTTPVQVSTTVPGQNGRLSFSASSGARVAVAISPGPSGSVSIVKPDGTTHASRAIGIFYTFIDTTVLPDTGDYSLFVDYLVADTGNVTLKLYSVPADISGSITPTGSGASAPIAVTVPGQNGALTFSGVADQRISVKVPSFSPDGTVSLRRPDGSVQASVLSGFLERFIDTQVLATSGTYSVKFDPSGAAIGTANLTVFDVPADTTGTVTIGGSAVSVSLGTPGQNGSLTFSGTQGQAITVKMTNNTIGTSGIRGPTTVRLLKADGTPLTSITSSALNFNLTSQTLPTTGTYTIVVDPGGAHTGSIDVHITNP